jgi:sugar phosphate isomerase/epimerase
MSQGQSEDDAPCVGVEVGRAGSLQVRYDYEAIASRLNILDLLVDDVVRADAAKLFDLFSPRRRTRRDTTASPFRRSRTAWHVNTWDSGYLDSLDYQWNEVALPFWTEIDALARDNGVKVAIEMHPQNLVFNPPTLRRLVERTGATNVGAEMDPSHLFWQGIDPIAAIEWLGPLVFHAAAKDTRINDNCKIYGVLDERFTRIPLDQNPTGLGGRHVVNKWPEDSAWDFVAVGRGHNVDFWARFLQALEKIEPNMCVNIEHEDVEFGPLEGLQVAAETLTAPNTALLR